MAPPILILRNIHLSFGGTPLLEDAGFSVSSGERLCLVGRNGSGKSTLLKLAAEMIEPDEGERYLQPGTTVRYLPQEPDLSGFETVREYVVSALGSGDEAHRANYLLEQLQISGHESPAHLSGGEARRAALAHVLAPEPDIILLDEPTNHLDLPAIEWLEEQLRSIRSALVLVSHDRRFLQNLSRATTWLENGITRHLDKGFAEFETWRDQILEKEDRDRHELNRKIAAEMQWLHKGVTARRKRNMGRLRALNALREERRSQRKSPGNARMTVTDADTSGKLVAETKHISKSFVGISIVKDLSIRIQRGDRVGLVGPNGAGKTTLINLLTGKLKPDEGTVRLGANLEMISLDQGREDLDPGATLSNALTGGGETVWVQGKAKHVVGYMKDFLFSPEQANTPVGALSGGERGRLMLARALAFPSNLLVLDEPTNDLDLETLDLLQEMLSDYGGTVLLVSHDRDFLDRIVTSVIASEGGGNWIEYAGGYSDMMSQRGADLTSRPATATGSDKSSTARAAGKPRPDNKRLTFKDKHALETLPGQMETLQREIDGIGETLADPSLFNAEPEKYYSLSQRLQEAQAELAVAEEMWLDLELRREELEKG